MVAATGTGTDTTIPDTERDNDHDDCKHPNQPSEVPPVVRVYKNNPNPTAQPPSYAAYGHVDPCQARALYFFARFRLVANKEAKPAKNQDVDK